MNKIRWIKTIGIVVSIQFISLWSLAQDVECTQRLIQAQRFYDQGRLTEVIPQLIGEKKNDVNCVREGFTKEQKTTAYRLMALVYIFLDDEPNAEDAIIDLLLVDPEHPTTENDPAEFEALYNKFRSKPIFRWGVFAGVNQTSANSLAEYGTYDASRLGNDGSFSAPHFLDERDAQPAPIEKVYDPGIGLHLGATFEYMPVDNLELILRAKMSWQNYIVNYPLITSVPTLEPADFAVTELQESQQWISIPLAVRYNVPIGKSGITPYVIGGVSGDYLLGAKLAGDRQGTTTVAVSFGEDLHEYDLREKINWTSFAGLGVKLSVQRINSLFIEGTYGIGGQNIVNGENRYASQDQNFNIAHIDNDKSINNISINIGFIMSVYKPIKYSAKKLARMSEKEEKRRSRRGNE